MRTVGMVSILILMLAVTASAEITLKQSFFAGWKYSTDGETYHRVGFLAGSLKDVISSNPEALELLDSYPYYKIPATIFAGAGVCVIGIALIQYIDKDEWRDRYTTMLIVGGICEAISIIISDSATNKLKSAVEIYNNEEAEKQLDIGFRNSTLGGDDAVIVSLSLTL